MKKTALKSLKKAFVLNIFILLFHQNIFGNKIIMTDSIKKSYQETFYYKFDTLFDVLRSNRNIVVFFKVAFFDTTLTKVNATIYNKKNKKLYYCHYKNNGLKLTDSILISDVSNAYIEGIDSSGYYFTSYTDGHGNSTAYHPWIYGIINSESRIHLMSYDKSSNFLFTEFLTKYFFKDHSAVLRYFDFR